MKLYEITITPTSAFGTLLKGDTLFGHFCWQVAYNSSLVEGGLSNQLTRYGEAPFVVFSSAFPKMEQEKSRYFLPRPEAISLDRSLETANSRKERLLAGKALKEKKWMAIDHLDVIEPAKTVFISDEELTAYFERDWPLDQPDMPVVNFGKEVMVTMPQPHNSIDRLTGTTGPGRFAPYTKEHMFYLPGITLVIFVLLDEAVTDIERVCAGLEKIGEWGFGRDASTGMGRFNLKGFAELPLPGIENANAFYTLAPSVPQQDVFTKAFFTPFVRFGKHGDRLATGKAPFKRPVIMADEGAVFMPATKWHPVPWLGTGISGVSYTEPATVAQGYAPWLPIKMEL